MLTTKEVHTYNIIYYTQLKCSGTYNQQDCQWYYACIYKNNDITYVRAYLNLYVHK